MVKRIYDTYGHKTASIAELAHEIEESVGIEMQAHEGLYAGVTYRYRGGFSDEIILKKRHEDDEKNVEFALLIHVANVSGKNADKMSKSKYVREKLLLIPGMYFISQRIDEDPN
jgi:hypothetical protein